MKRLSSRMIPAALVAVFALAACGGGTDGSSASEPDETVPSVTDDGLMAPRPIEITSAGGGATPAAAEVATDARVSDMMMPYWIANYVVGDGMPALPANDVGYVFQAGNTVTAEQVAALAATLGAQGDPIRTDDGYSVSWRVGPDDGSAPALWVYEDAQLSWNFNNAWATRSASVDCAVAVDSTGTQTESCPEATPPEGVPTAAEAEQRARDMIAATGADPAAYQFETYGDEWYASVSAYRRVDGLFDANRFDFGFGAGGEMQYASGQLAEPQRVGPYPLIGLDEAIARLNDQNAMWAGGYGGGVAVDVARADDLQVSVAESGVAEQAPDATPASMPAEEPPAAGVPGESSSGESLPVVSPPIETLPVESLPPDVAPEPESITVTLVGVEADVWWAWDVDGSVWLLPAYRFIDTDGGWHVVPAVTDEFMIQVTPPIDAPLPMPEPMPAVDPPVVVDPAPDAAGTEPELFDTTALESSVGKSLADFTADAKALGADVRVVEQDGVALAVTMDFAVNRVNVAVDGDTVTAITSVG